MGQIQFCKRTIETLEEIANFYRSVGYHKQIDDTDQFFFAYQDNKIIAVVRVARKYGEFVLRGLYVEEGMQNRGVGTKMLSFVAPYLDGLRSGCYCVPFSHI